MTESDTVLPLLCKLTCHKRPNIFLKCKNNFQVNGNRNVFCAMEEIDILILVITPFDQSFDWTKCNANKFEGSCYLFFCTGFYNFFNIYTYLSKTLRKKDKWMSHIIQALTLIKIWYWIFMKYNCSSAACDNKEKRQRGDVLLWHTCTPTLL